MENLYIFYTNLTNKEDNANDKRLSAINSKEDKLFGEKILINKEDKLIFFNSKNFLKKDNEKYDELFFQTLEKAKNNGIDISSLKNIYVFFHGSEVRKASLFRQLNEKDEIVKKIRNYDDVKNKYNNINIDVFFFSHDKRDPIYLLLKDYQTAFFLAYISDYDNLNKAIEEYIKRLKNLNLKIEDYSKNQTYYFEERKISYLKNNKEIEKEFIIFRFNFNIFYFDLNTFLDKVEEKYEKKPIIAISPFNFIKKEDPLYDTLNSLEPNIKFLDSSIWFRTIVIKPIDDSGNTKSKKTIKEEEEKELSKTTEELTFFYENGIYDSAVAVEFRDLQLQLARIKTLEGGAHETKVNPINFHSETQMKEKADDLFNKIKDFKWDFLLIDDFADRPLRKYKKDAEKEEDSNEFPTKTEILKKIINEEFVGKFDFALAVDNENVNNDKLTAVEKINNNKYDVILLDYLFSNEDIFKKNKTQYGIKLFNLIKNNTIYKNKSIKNKYWIFPVSTFNSALLSDMEQQGIEFDNLDWYFSPGADPINTPNLFRYKLYNIILLQKAQVVFQVKHILDIFFYYWDEKKIKDKNDIKKWAFKTLNLIIERFYHILLIKYLDENDDKDLSVFLLNTYSQNKQGEIDLLNNLIIYIQHFLYYTYDIEFNQALFEFWLLNLKEKLLEDILKKYNFDGYFNELSNDFFNYITEKFCNLKK